MMHNKKISKQREKKAGKDIGGREHIASGSLWFRKGDASNEDFLIEDKFTSKNYYSVSFKVLYKLESQSLKVRKVPILRFGFFPDEKNYAVVHTKYCNAPEENLELCIGTLSFKFDKQWLEKMFVKSKSKIFICDLVLQQEKYIVMRWEEFVDNQEIFLAK